MGNEIVLSNQIEQAIDSAVKDCNVMVLAELSPLQQAVRLATGMQALRSALNDEVMKTVFMPLQGSKLGFVTDKDKPPWNATPEEVRNFKPGYSINIVRDCLIEALMNGLRPVNNEFNIIANNMYAAKNGIYRLVCDFPGISDLEITPSPPIIGEKGDSARVSIRASWKLNGKPASLVRDVTKGENGQVEDTRIAIRVNKGMGLDAILGKAERKLYYSILLKLRQSHGMITVTDGDAFEVQGSEVPESAPAIAPPERDGKRMHLGNAKREESAREPGQEG